MGMMKQYLMEKTGHLAKQLGIDEAKFYSDDNLINLATCYAQYLLKKEQKESSTREEIKKAILARLDEVVSVIQELIGQCDGGEYLSRSMEKISLCCTCRFSFLCEKSTQYK